MNLFEYIKGSYAKKELRFIDADINSSISLEDLLNNLLPFPATNKKIAFLYLDNSLDSIRIFFSFLNSNHALFLLGRTIHRDLKIKLEGVYQPDFIVDADRDDLISYDKLDSTGNATVYYKSLPECKIAPDIRILLSTSGTTGSPKFVKLTDKNFISNTTSILDYLPIEPSDVTILNLPVFYSYGLSVLLTNIMKGGTIICTNETVLSRNFWSIFKQYGCNNIAGVPYTYEMMSRLGFLKMKNLGLKYMTQAGGKLNIEATKKYADYAEENHAKFFVMYGQTEATARMSYLEPSMLKSKLGSIGKPIKGGTFHIDKGNEELIYTGDNVFSGYAESPADLTDCVPQMELRTGDVARVDEDGFYYITGRLKRFIKLFGNRVGFDEIEADMRTRFNCYVGCCGIEDKYLLIFSDNSSLKGDEVLKFATERYKIHISAIRYFYIEKIPLTPNMKTDYTKILQAYGS